MSAIAGFVGPGTKSLYPRNASPALSTWTDIGVELRYSSVDPVRTAFFARGRLAIVAAARIDGKDDLLGHFDFADRAELMAVSDAELILRCFERWGADCLHYLIGAFSFAVWDRDARSLFCARDHFGIEPLFYSSTVELLSFSNSLDDLNTVPPLDQMFIADFLLFGESQDPAATAFAHIRRLPPGHSLSWRAGKADIRRYWTLPVDGYTRFPRNADYVDGFRELLQRAVSDCMHPERTAILMSGGLDSTMVAAVAAEKKRDVKSFAIVYDSLIPDPERHFAQLAAGQLHIPVQFLVADGYRLFERAQATPEPIDEPLPAILTDHLLQVNAYSPVALSGIGGDPLLFPSPNYAADRLSEGAWGELASSMWNLVRLRRQIPRVGFRSKILRGLRRRKNENIAFPVWLNQDFVKELSLMERWERFVGAPVPSVNHERPEAYENLSDPKWSRIFETYAPAVTGVSVEVRHPLFDLRLVKYCLGLPPIPWCVDKTIARIAMKDRLPNAVGLRPKSRSADPVAPRLAASSWVDSWEVSPALVPFVDRSRVPILATIGGAWDPHLRPYALNAWLTHLTGP